jgi:hypothetical protein
MRLNPLDTLLEHIRAKKLPLQIGLERFKKINTNNNDALTKKRIAHREKTLSKWTDWEQSLEELITNQ